MSVEGELIDGDNWGVVGIIVEEGMTSGIGDGNRVPQAANTSNRKMKLVNLDRKREEVAW